VEELSVLTGTQAEGTSLLGLCAAGQAKGLLLWAYETTLPGLQEILAETGRPAIALLRRSHYVVVEAASATEVCFVDPLCGPRRLGASEFARAWSGYLLALAGIASAAKD
jgi:ABC-type bacteriocin/lantibiotic exporter with double-glycine peptidase domain